MKLLKAGAAYYGEFVTSRFSSGAAYDATGTPTATATRNGTDDGAFTLTVTKIDTGRYKVAGTIPAYTAGDNVQVSVAATVDSVAAKGVVDEFYVVAIDLTDAAKMGLTNLDAAITTRHHQGDAVAKSPATLAVGDVSGGNLPADVKAITAGVDFSDTMKANLSSDTDIANQVWAALPTFTVVADAGNSATQFKTDRSEAANDFWKDTLVLITSGALAGQVKKCTAYNGTAKALTVSAFTGTPAAGVTGMLLNR